MSSQKNRHESHAELIDLLMHVVCDTRHPERQIQASRMIEQIQREPSEPTLAAPALSEQDGVLLEQGASMLEALAADERYHGNDSSAMGAECSAHAVRRLAVNLRGAPVASARPSNSLHGFIKPDSETHVYFYEQDFYVLSNFSAFPLTWKTSQYLYTRFATSEQAYHWEKFKHIGGRGVQELLEEALSAHDAFTIAQKHSALRREDWDEVKVEVMRNILRAKVDQHEYVKRKLLATGDRILVEDSWRDDFWGWGPNRDGQNVLGKLWMEVRAELRSAMAKKGGAA